MSNATIPVYDGEKRIGKTTYTNNLDVWDGSQWVSAGQGFGHHLGLNRCRGKYALIHGTDYQNDNDYAEVIDARLASAIIEKIDTELFRDFPELKSVKPDFSRLGAVLGSVVACCFSSAAR